MRKRTVANIEFAIVGALALSSANEYTNDDLGVNPGGTMSAQQRPSGAQYSSAIHCASPNRVAFSTGSSSRSEIRDLRAKS